MLISASVFKLKDNWRRKVVLCSVLVAILVLSVSRYANSQSNDNENICSGGLASFLCKAGHAVIGGARQIAKTLINRPNHWGVPDNEPLELADDFNVPGNRGPQPARPHYGFNEEERRQGPRRRERVHCTTIDGLKGVCRPLAACYHRHGPNLRYEPTGGQCPLGASLVCCPRRSALINQQQGDDTHRPRFTLSPIGFGQPQYKVPLASLRDIISQIFGGGNDNLNLEAERANEIERNIVRDGAILKKHSPSDQHQRFIQLRNGKEISKLAKDGSDFLAVAMRIAKQQLESSGDGCRKVVKVVDGSSITVEDCKTELGNQESNRRKSGQLADIDFSETSLASRCPGDPICPINAARLRFRSIDGSCNNLKHTGWGKANSPYSRILPPDYEDGLNEIRKTGVTGNQLPNPRSVSLATVRWGEKPDARTTVMLMQWGQFIDHDLSLAATTPMQTPQGSNIDCCNRKMLTDPRFRHPACISILLPDNDPFYAKFQVGCMNLVRSAPSPPIGCKLRAREQLNQLTHFLDGSMIYGNDEQQASGLRQFSDGLLKSSRINGMEFLPFDGRVGEGCILPLPGIRRGMRCFVAGDNRVNELTGLVTMHALFLREHNRVARIIAQLNRQWSDEKIFQEARRVVSVVHKL